MMSSDDRNVLICMSLLLMLCYPEIRKIYRIVSGKQHPMYFAVPV